MMDLKALEESLTTEQVIELLADLGAVDYHENRDTIIFKTICHNVESDEASFKLYYYKNSHQFHCYTECGCNFNIYNLFKKRFELLGMDYNFYKDIVLKIAGKTHYKIQNGFYNVYKSDVEKYRRQEMDVELKPVDECLLNGFQKRYPIEWLDDGISKGAMDQFNILYSIAQNKIIIPHYDKDGILIGIRGRSLNEEDIAIGKYMPITIGDTTFAHPLGYNLYGLNLNKDNIRRRRTAIVFEGEKSVLLYETYFGRDNNIAVAVCGSNFSNYQFELLRSIGVERILIAFDKESENWAEAEKQKNKLRTICNRYKNDCIMGFLYDNDNLLELKDSPIDKGKEIFKQIYKKGVV